MKCVWLGKVTVLLLACSGLLAADSIELRNGRRLQGKFIGGTAAVVGFMTGNTIEYFAIPDVLALIFDRNLDSTMNGSRPDPMKHVERGNTPVGNMRRVDKADDRSQGKPKLKRASGSIESAAERGGVRF